LRPTKLESAKKYVIRLKYKLEKPPEGLMLLDLLRAYIIQASTSTSKTEEGKSTASTVLHKQSHCRMLIFLQGHTKSRLSSFVWTITG
jgi:hypothetical protein